MEEGYIYILKWRTVYKIGCAKNYKERVKRNLDKKPEAKLIRVYKCKNYTNLEFDLHRIFDKFRVSGNAEWFAFTSKDFKKVKEIIEVKNNTIFKKINFGGEF